MYQRLRREKEEAEAAQQKENMERFKKDLKGKKIRDRGEPPL